MKAVQYFDDEYLKSCKNFSVKDILNFIEGFRQLQGSKKAKTKLISIKIETDLLEQFRRQSELEGRPYQSKIKDLMRVYCKRGR